MIVVDDLLLPPDLRWVDEHGWSPVRQTQVTALSGAGTLFSAAPGPRTVTLEASEESGWLPEVTVSVLVGMAAQPGATFRLIIRDRSFTVAFRHHDPPALDLSPLIPRGAGRVTNAPGPWIGRIKFIVI